MNKKSRYLKKIVEIYEDIKMKETADLLEDIYENNCDMVEAMKDEYLSKAFNELGIEYNDDSYLCDYDYNNTVDYLIEEAELHN